MSSIWKASFGSPSRSWRITQAVIVFGSSPGADIELAHVLYICLCQDRIPPWGGVRDRPLML